VSDYVFCRSRPVIRGCRRPQLSAIIDFDGPIIKIAIDVIGEGAWADAPAILGFGQNGGSDSGRVSCG